MNLEQRIIEIQRTQENMLERLVKLETKMNILGAGVGVMVSTILTFLIYFVLK